MMIQMVPGQVAHLGGEDRAHQGAGAGDGGEVVAEQDVAVRADVVLAVGFVLRGGGTAVVRLEQVALDDLGVEAVADQVGAHRGEHEPDGVDRFTADDREHEPCHGAQQGDAHPERDLGRRPFALFGVAHGLVHGCGRQGRIRRNAVLDQ